VAALLKKELAVSTTLIKGGGGMFEVAVDGAVVAKKTLSGFPKDRDVVEKVRAALAN